METLLINYQAREKRFASILDNRVEKIVIDRPDHRSLVGNIYYGTVSKVLPGMNAVFIDIGEEKNAYLHRDLLVSYVLADSTLDKEKRSVTSFVHQGEKLLVQVDKDATGPKGPRVTGIIELQGDHLIYMPKGRYVAVSKRIAVESQKASLRKFGQSMKEEDEGIIFRTSSMSCRDEELAEELANLRGQYQEMLQSVSGRKKPGLILQKDSFREMILEHVEKMKDGEVIVDDLVLKKLVEEKNTGVRATYYSGKENIFSNHKVEHEVDKALKRVVWLDNGAYLIFDETEALTIVDVNTGKFSGKSDYQDTVFKTNQLAAKEIARQLKLRDIGGIVLIDFIDMKREQDKKSILEIMESEGRKDEKRTKVIGFTPLGILQMTRKKTKVSLSEALQVKCPVCDGTGRIMSAETIGFKLERELLEHRQAEYEAVLIETTQEVKAALLGPNEAHKQALEEMLHLTLFFIIQPALQPYYVLKQFGDIREIGKKVDDHS